jgi:hypothetical protein
MSDSPILTLNTQRFRQGLYDSAIAGIREGAVLERVDGLRAFHVNSRHEFHAYGSSARRAGLERDIAAARRAAARARANASEVEDEDEETAGDFRADAVRSTRKARALQAELDSLDTAAEASEVGPLECDGSYIARALANLAHLPLAVDSETRDAVLRIVTDLTIVHRTSRSVTFEWWLRFPVRGGVARLGPLRFNMTHRTPAHRSLPTHADRFLERVRPGIAVAKLKPRQLQAQARHVMKGAGIGEQAALTASNCTIPEVLDALAAFVLGEEAEPGSYAAHVVATYTDPTFSWTPSTYAQDCLTRQRVINAVVDAPNPVTPRHLHRQLQPLNRDAIDAVMRHQRRPGGRTIVPTVDNPSTSNIPARDQVSLVECMHCGERATIAIATPEIPDRLLCRNCMRMPRIDTSPVFPASYLSLKVDT